MRALLSFLVAALLVVCSSSVPRGQGRITLPPFKLDVKEHRLANGVTVLVVERPAAGRVAARVFYRSDIAGEKPGTYGLTHLLEHYLFKGSPSRSRRLDSPSSSSIGRRRRRR
jgi:predicted Zn-dependent peptidase